MPAPVDEVWALLADPARMPEWDPGIGSVETATGADAAASSSTTDVAANTISPGISDAAGPRPGVAWTGLARTERPDGAPIRIKPEFRRQRIELVAREEGSLIAWRFTYPDASRANTRSVEIALEPAAGGARLTITLSWIRNPRRRALPLLGLIMRPLVRYAIWMQLSQIGGGISRVFR